LVGEDAYGRRIGEEFKAAGTDVSLLETRPGHTTPTSILLINRQTGSRTIVNRKIKAGPLQLDAGILRRLSPKVLLFDGHELPAALEALKAFPDAISILDAGSWREGTAQLAALVDYLAASERFALQSTGMAHMDSDDARRDCIQSMRKLYATAVIVTLGEHGLVADDGHEFIRLPAFPARAIDTTAAGDVFHGALAHAVAHGIPFKDGLRLASMAAALSVQAAGGRGSIPAFDRVKEALTAAV